MEKVEKYSKQRLLVNLAILAAPLQRLFGPFGFDCRAILVGG
jgi:hypothetical protein